MAANDRVKVLQERQALEKQREREENERLLQKQQQEWYEREKLQEEREEALKKKMAGEREIAIKREELIREKERIKMRTLEYLKQQMKLIFEGRVELRKDLTRRRESQVAGVPESDKLRDQRREEICKIYEDFAAKQIPPIIE